MVWRCATRVEKGRNACPESPTLKDEEISEKIRNAGKLLVYKDKVNIYN